MHRAWSNIVDSMIEAVAQNVLKLGLRYQNVWFKYQHLVIFLKRIAARISCNVMQFAEECEANQV